jgi:hypothetical protein
MTCAMLPSIHDHDDVRYFDRQRVVFAGFQQNGLLLRLFLAKLYQYTLR